MNYLKLNFGAKEISLRSTDYTVELAEAVECGIELEKCFQRVGVRISKQEIVAYFTVTCRSGRM